MKSIICIGSVLLDIIGRHPDTQPIGFDQGGRIQTLPGGVAMNIAMVLRDLNQDIELLSYLGLDNAGDRLLEYAQNQGMRTDHIDRADLPTDRYMAIEAGGNLFGAIADAHSLEKRESAVISPLLDGRLGNTQNPWDGQIVLDGNLTKDSLRYIANHDAFARADIRLAPASPGKVLRLRAFLDHPNTTLYVNLQESNSLMDSAHKSTLYAANALFERGGIKQVIVTDGGNPCAFVNTESAIEITPPAVMVHRITGAGDCFMAAHIAAQRDGANAQEALKRAANYTANYITSEEMP